MSTFCGTSGLDFSKMKSVNFKTQEIKNFYNYFKRISNGSNSIDYTQFKRSFGILGNSEEEFVCKRLFYLIQKQNSERVIK